MRRLTVLAACAAAIATVAACSGPPDIDLPSDAASAMSSLAAAQGSVAPGAGVGSSADGSRLGSGAEGGDDSGVAAGSAGSGADAGSPFGSAAGRSSAKPVTTKVDKTGYFAGFKVDVKSATYTPTDQSTIISFKPNLVLDTVVTNQGDHAADMVDWGQGGVEIDLAVGDHHWQGEPPQGVTIPGKAKNEVKIGFTVDDNFAADQAVLTLGSADVVRTVIPLGDHGTLVANEPKQVPAGTPISAPADKSKAGSISVAVTGGTIRADYPGQYKQVGKGQRMLVLNYDATLDADGDTTESFSYDDLSITGPDGDTVTADDRTSAKYTVAHTLDSGETKHFTAEFVIPKPTDGASYTLNVKHEDSLTTLGGTKTTTFAGEGPLVLG